MYRYQFTRLFSGVHPGMSRRVYSTIVMAPQHAVVSTPTIVGTDLVCWMIVNNGAKKVQRRILFVPSELFVGNPPENRLVESLLVGSGPNSLWHVVLDCQTDAKIARESAIRSGSKPAAAEGSGPF